MTLDELNSEVTDAILRAENCSPGTAEHDKNWLEVSFIEETIACLTKTDSVEGGISRIGAVTAAIEAHDLARARSLAQKYLTENLIPGIRTKLEKLLIEWILLF